MEKIKNYYEFYLDKYKIGHKAVNWSSKRAQQIRFEKMMDLPNLENSSLLDVGCGLGHLTKFLKNKNFKTKYLGVDISKKMIEAAKKINNKHDKKFYVCDILTKKKSAFLKKDYVVNCGVFTVKSNYTNDEWWKFISKMLIRMFELSRKGIAFNLLTDKVDYKEKHLFYVSHEKIINFAVKNLSEKIICKKNPQVWENVYYVFK